MSGTVLTFNAGSSTVKLGVYAVQDGGLRHLARAGIDFRDDPLEVRLILGEERLAHPLKRAEDGDMTPVLHGRWTGWRCMSTCGGSRPSGIAWCMAATCSPARR